MNKNLVIVESPAKAKTIEKFLGKDFKVLSSYGHIRDLKAKEISIDFEHNYKPEYVIPTDKKKLVTELKKEAKKSEVVWLASDEDREGEAISWHLSEALELDPAKTKRIVFHEITKNAILHAIETPREINIDLVNAQQARRVLDRIVGFELSPILWKKVKPALSAGRVQSVAVRLIVERERDINAFVSEASYRVIATFVLPDGTTLLKAELNKRLKDKKEVLAFLESCRNAAFSIEDITRKPVRKSPAPPFTTSTLQQEAARKLGFSVSQTMTLAQRLYESGFITYMRTDSVNLSNLALGAAKEAIIEEYGEKYYKFRQYNTKTKGAQEAHEAIRPTYLSQTEISGSAQEKRLYDMIRKRTIASQMADAELERTTITVAISNNKKEKFAATGEVITFDGFLQVYLESNDEEGENEQDNGLLPAVNLNDVLLAKDIVATERFTQRPPRYTEASLVRRLEELGIGRPSTYAPTIQTVQNREYVVKGDKEGINRDYEIISLENDKISEVTKTEKVGFDRNKLMPTDIGTVVNDFLLEYFPDILDYNFTASVEKEFDTIADGELEWTKAIDKFYKFFHPKVDEVKAIRTEHKVGERQLGIDPKSGNPVFVKIGRYGPIAQIGQANPDDKEAPKPQFASLMKGQSIETITLEEALKLFDLPRTVGEYNGQEVVAAVGRFGPFIRHDGKFVSIPKTLNPLSITLEESIALIEEKQQKEAQRFIKKFEEEPELEILNGRFGPYIAYKGKNYKIPRKGTKPEDLTLEEVRQIIEEADKNPKPAKKTTKKRG
ncbi:DNA topoisomerase-1 [Parabacteroides sp. PFB2-12]|uniref:type I DNA topoisomerase n=1 Tax=unclassified Parabacteroides TaxID=2649774 RepID=UPI0024754DDC|nr:MULTISPECIES: type I DNA topoisomerase [unclassified Parabacteroides]MDH6341258.1 DNA topoisomerase-1 [Parabacteroides sp. PM6-13]MDH6389050.1 DNA topoisomerase-1 [Parabacteroides sp. PFB2-12]